MENEIENLLLTSLDVDLNVTLHASIALRFCILLQNYFS